MATIQGATELLEFVQSGPSAFAKSVALAHAKVVANSQVEAIRIAKRQFIGRNGRRLTGRLFNSIRSGIEKVTATRAEGFLGTFGIPYGRIHEEGGKIEPVRANHLWVKNHMVEPKFQRLTPREFVSEMKARRNPDEKFAILKSKSGKLTAFHIKRVGVGSSAREVFQALFFLRDEVLIPKRPYLAPALVIASNKFPEEFAQFLESELNK